jgi:hypothetical protein
VDIDRLKDEFETEVKGKMQPNDGSNPMRKGWLRYPLFRSPAYYTRTAEKFAHIFERLTYLHEILDTHLKGSTLVGALYAIIPPQGSIGIHQDHVKSKNKEKSRAMNETVRLHIPLHTSDQVYMLMGAQFHHMKEGEFWMLNNHHYHGVLNADNTLHRNHLILDVVPSEELIKMLQEIEAPKGFNNNKHLKYLMQHSDKTKARSFVNQFPIPTRIPLLIALFFKNKGLKEK